MIRRHLESVCFDPLFGRQMRFIAGPRQVGKTTLAKAFLAKNDCKDFYYNWDKREVRQRFRREPHFFHTDALQHKSVGEKWFCFDEIHKVPRWKDILKDSFDSFEEQYHLMVTGSARLDLFRKSGDSLSGRYFLFRLLPISLFEIEGRTLSPPDKNPLHFIENSIHSPASFANLEQLIRFGGFPEPLTRANTIFHTKWQEGIIDTLVKEDLRDLTRIHEVENVATFLSLLPERVGAPLSLNSLKEDLEVSTNAAKNYLRSLILTYILFEIPPYTRKINRALRKARKIYFYDWTHVKDPAKRFENYVAVELRSRIEFWSATTPHHFALHYIRSQDGRETDFLITRDRSPFFLVEATLSEEKIAAQHRHHAKVLGEIPLVQIIQKPGIVTVEEKTNFVLSATAFL